MSGKRVAGRGEVTEGSADQSVLREFARRIPTTTVERNSSGRGEKAGGSLIPRADGHSEGGFSRGREGEGVVHRRPCWCRLVGPAASSSSLSLAVSYVAHMFRFLPSVPTCRSILLVGVKSTNLISLEGTFGDPYRAGRLGRHSRRRWLSPCGESSLKSSDRQSGSFCERGKAFLSSERERERERERDDALGVKFAKVDLRGGK